jgi:hypothetical protein
MHSVLTEKRAIDYAKPVEVYWNLHKGGWSIRQGGKVCGHFVTVRLRDCTFVINARLRAMFDAKRSRRTVHAWVKGYLVQENADTIGGETVRYNPFEHTAFTRVSDSSRVDTAQEVYLHENRRIEARGFDEDPTAVLRAIWTEKGVSPERQAALFAEIEQKAQPGTQIGPFVIP